ncbi:MAG: ABC transporter substrate-binding protein [Burkholderiaceae bacterium]
MISVASGVTLGVAMPAFAQGRVWRIGVVYPTLSKDYMGDPMLRDALHDLGYEEGRNVAYERRFTEGRDDGHGPPISLYSELLEARVDVVLTFGDKQTVVAKNVAASTIPIVMLYSDAPVEIGLIKSLSRPGGNITGVTTAGIESAQKSLQMLRDIVPTAKHLGVLLDPTYSVSRLYIRAYQQAAAVMGCKLTILLSHTLDHLDFSLASMVKDRLDALLVSGEGVVYANRARIIAFVALQRVPAMYVHAQYVTEGGLISRNPDAAERTHRVAAIIHRIFKGEKPADIPVEQPTKFKVTINLKTAKAMDLTIPQSVRLQATEVIE